MAQNPIVYWIFIKTVIDTCLLHPLTSVFLLPFVSSSFSADSHLCRTLPLPCRQLKSGAYQQQASLRCATGVSASWWRTIGAGRRGGALGRRGLASGGGAEREETQIEQRGEAVQTE